MTRIPDDVVERANMAFAAAGDPRNHWRDCLRVAGEVFVAWEREQIIELCEMIAGGNEHSDAMDVISAIIARSAPEKE